MMHRREIGRKLVGEEEAGEVLGIGTIKEYFQERGTRPEEIEWLNNIVRGCAIEVAVALSIRMEMESGPDADLEGREEMREMIDSSEQRNSSGHRGGGEIGGVGLRGGAVELKQEAK